MLPGSRARIVRCGGRYDPQLVSAAVSEWVSHLVQGKYFPPAVNVSWPYLSRFCRTMLCISAAYAIKRCPCLRLCVRLSVTFVNAIKPNKHISKNLHLKWASNAGGVSWFSTNIWFCDRCTVVSISHGQVFCWLRVSDDQAPRAISSHGSPWLCTVRDRQSAVSQ